MAASKLCKYTKCTYKETTGDGLCFYRSVSLFKYSTQHSCKRFRTICVNEICSNWQHFKQQYINADGQYKYRSMLDFRREHEKVGLNEKWEYATHVDMEVLSNKLDLNLILVGVGKSLMAFGENVYPLGFFGSRHYTDTLAIRVENHGTESAHFQPFDTIPPGYADRLNAFLQDKEKDEELGRPVPEPTTPKKSPGRPPKSAAENSKRKSSPTTLPSTPHKHPKQNNSDITTPKSKQPPAVTPKPPTKRKGDVQEIGSKKTPKCLFGSPNSQKIGTFLDITDVTHTGVRPHVDFVYQDNFEEWPDDPGVPKSPDNPSTADNEPVERKKPWAALDAVSTAHPLLSNLGAKCFSKYYMSAANHGDEHWLSLRPLELPPLQTECEYCGALFRVTELYNKSSRPCCQSGKIRFEDKTLFKTPTDELRSLYENRHSLSNNFKASILAYNRMFSTIQFIRDRGQIQRKGPMTIQTVNGKVTFEPNSFESTDVLAPGQIYFVEENHDSVNRRMATSSDGVVLDDYIVNLLQKYLENHNPFVQCFKTTHELQQEELIKAAARGDKPREFILAINPRPKQRSGYRMAMEDIVNRMLDNEFARPCKDFLAAVFFGNLKEIHYDTFYVSRRREENDIFPRVTGSELTIDVQTYPLIHLHAENSWLSNTKMGEDASTTLRQYYNWRLQIRDENFNPLFSSGKLFSEYILNAAIRIEKQKLDYLAQPDVQKNKLKAATYKTLINYISSQRSESNKRPGKFVVLPKTFVNSPRWRQNRFLNGMAMARKFGPPTWFLTMTTSPKWPEILAALKPDETWVDRPDVVVRSFQDRKRHLMSDLIHKQLFGRVKAYFLTDEFQKSSLPHVHILLFMHPEDKPKSPEEVDQFISAEIPDKKHPVYNIVIENMMHHACHQWSRKKPPACHSDGKRCRFRFPADWSLETDIDSRFIKYRRRPDGRQVRCKTTGKLIDNRNCVPTNHYLLLRHVCHICVLVCMTTLEAFKYLCVYLNKNADKAYVSLTDKNRRDEATDKYEWDEIEHYRECRYMNAAEGVYIIKSHDFGQSSHSVIVLPFHLEDEQSVLFVEGAEEDSVTDVKDSMLMGWFKLNEKVESDELNNITLTHDPREIQYVDLPSHYTWDKLLKNWKARNREDSLGRLGLVLPNANNLEVFYLRSLLMNIPGATSFQHLRTVNGIEYNTNAEACEAYGLAENSKLSGQTLDELRTVVNAKALRYHFCLIIKWCLPDKPYSLWDNFKDSLSDDLPRRGEPVTEIHHSIALSEIKSILTQMNVDYEKTGLPKVKDDLYPDFIASRENLVEKAIDLAEFQTSVENLRPSQKYIFDRIIQKIENPNSDGSNILLLLGAGGVGKTYLYNTVIRYCQSKDYVYSACAYTGIAATLLIGGQTAHRLFGIPIKEENSTSYLSNISTESERAGHLLSTKVIIWDEISMVHKWQLEIVDQFLRRLTKIDKPFGSRIMILSGDMRQILPVCRRGYRKKTVESCIVHSSLWKHIDIFEMTKNIRAEHDPDFADWLLKVGEGTANQRGTSRVDLSPEMLLSDLESLINAIFPNGPLNTTGQEVILTPLNKDMREVNDMIADKIPRRKTTYYSYNKFEPDGTWDGKHIPVTPDILESTDSANLPPHRLHLKVGAVVMLLCNLDVSRGLCNGARLRVLACLENTVKCEKLSGHKKVADEPIYLFKVYISKDDVGLPGVITRRQFPIRLAFCVTINKSQGSTYDRVGIHLPAPCFSHGQLYVALSRSKNRNNVFFHLRKGSEQGFTLRRNKTRYRVFTRNEVYREVLEAVQKHPNYTKMTEKWLCEQN